MKYIIDTHILIWTILDPEKLSQNTLQTYEHADEIQVSNINFWEISLKYRLGKLNLGGLTPKDIFIAAKESNFKIINIDSDTASTLYKLPLRDHKDPFDRLLIWHSIKNETTLISQDDKFSQYEEDGLILLG